MLVPHPPRLALRFFRWYCNPRLAYHIEGDLLEVYAARCRARGKRYADLRFIVDVLLLCRPGIIKPLEGHQRINSFGMIKNYFTLGWRNLWKHKGYALINIGGLAFGMIAAMLMLLYLQHEQSYDRFHEKSSRLYRVVVDWENPDGSVRQHDGVTGHLQGPKFQAGIPEILDYARWQPNQMTFKIDQEVLDMNVHRADPSFFDLFSFPLLTGNARTALSQPRSIILSEGKALQYFNTTDVLGKTLDIKEDTVFVPYQITGVAKSIPAQSSIAFDFIIPNIVTKEEFANEENWFNFFQNTFVELHPSADPKQVEEKMQQVYESDGAAVITMMKEKYNVTEKARYKLQALTDMHLSEIYTTANGLRDPSKPMYSYLLSGIALFILLIACINFINLSIANSLQRAKEIGVRKVVGGSKQHVATQFMVESFVTCTIAFVLALALVPVCLPVFNALAVKTLDAGNLLRADVLLSYFGVLVVTGLLAGLYPAVVLSGFNPVKTLYGRFRFTGKNLLQRTLVVVQFALAAFLIMATITIYLQFDFLTTYDLGYDDKNLVIVRKYPFTPAQVETFTRALLTHPGIRGVAPKNGGEWGTMAKVNGEQMVKFQYNIVDDQYLPLMRIPMVSGRGFSADFTADASDAVLVNEAFVKEAGWKEPLGQLVDFYFWGKKYHVVGVVKNHHFNSLSQGIMPQLFIRKPGENFGAVFIRLDGEDRQAALAHLEHTFKAQFPDFTFSYTFREDENAAQYESEARWNTIILVAAVLTVLISCVGLLGLAALTAGRRAKEVGVRKVLGASVTSLAQLLSAHFLLLVALSFVFAVPAAYFASQVWLSTYAYHIEFGIGTVLLTLVITMGVSLVTVGSLAVRTALANPVESLKTE